LLLGRHLVGGTEYMWDSRFPLFVRLLSLFHVFMPVVLLWSLRRVGYDRRGWKLQSAILAGLLVSSRLCDPALNLNYAFSDPIFHRAWGPAPVHVAVMFVAIVAIFYWPTHLFLAWIFPAARETESRG
jgi:Zn-dependent protease